MKPKKEIHDTISGTLEEKITIGKGIYYSETPKLLGDYAQDLVKSMWNALPSGLYNLPDIDYEVIAMKQMLNDLAKEVHKLKQR